MAPSDSADLIKATTDYWIAQGTSSGKQRTLSSPRRGFAHLGRVRGYLLDRLFQSGSLVLHSYDQAGKLGGKAPQIDTACRVVQSFEVSPFDDLLAVGGDNGHVSCFSSDSQHLKGKALTFCRSRSTYSTSPLFRRMLPHPCSLPTLGYPSRVRVRSQSTH